MINPSKVDRWIFQASLVYIREAFYVFGGNTDINENDTTIGKLNADLLWSKVGDLNKGRFGHNVIFDGNSALVVGGWGENDNMSTENCSVSSSGIICTDQSPSLNGYGSYPELFMVCPNFCEKQF